MDKKMQGIQAMRVIALVGMVALAMVFAPMAQAAKPAATPSKFYVPLNRSELIATNSDIAEVIVADPEVANVVVHGKRRVSVLGVAVGQTTVRILDTNHRVLRSTDVYVTYDLPALRRSLKELLPNERIGVSMVNTRIALTGEVSSAAAADSAVDIATEYVSGKLIGDKVLTRKVADGTKDESPIINLMKVGAGQQVMLRIKIGEVNRTTLRNLGVNLQAIGSGSLNFALATGLSPAASIAANALGSTAASDAAVAALPPGSTTEAIAAARSAAVAGYASDLRNQSVSYSRTSGSFGSMGANMAGSKGLLSSQIEALEQDGLLKVLAEPTLTALSGEEAQFLAGGEFPIPVPQNLGGGTSTVTIQYKPYGVALKFIPYVLSPNRLRIQVQPEVSDISPENSLTANGFTVPSFVTRRASTTVELAPGESFMLAGLLRDDMTSRINQLPGAGEIPVLGALFRSTAYQRRETELVIAVTPYLVDPLRDADVKLPTDEFRPPSFFESVFFGAVSAGRNSKNTSLEGTTGFMTDN